MANLTYTDIYEQFNRKRVTDYAKDPDYSGTAISSGALTIDKRYEFITAGSGADFSNVGFTGTPDVGDSFYATASLAPTTWGGATIYCGMSPSDIVENEIANARLEFTAIAEYCEQTFSEDASDSIGLAMKYWVMWLVFLRSQNEKMGEGERRTAIGILTRNWGQGVVDYFNGEPKIETNEAAREKLCYVSNIDYSDDNIEDWD